MSEPAETKSTTDKRIVEFVPFGTDEKIKLSVEIVKRLVCVKTKSGKSCSDDEALKFILMCQARKLNPFEGDAFLIGYDSQQGPTFSLITAHQAFLKRAEIHPEFDGMDSGVIVLREGQYLDLPGDFHLPTDKVLGGWATVFFKNRSHPMKKRLRASRFNKGWGIWKDDEAGMIVKCTEADALRSSFPTQLGGLFVREEREHIIDVSTPTFPETPTTPALDEPKKRLEAPEQNNEIASAPVAEQPKKKVKSSSPIEAQSSPSTLKRKLTLTKKGRSEEKRQPNHEMLATRLAVDNFGPSDLIGLAAENGWIEPSESSFEKLSEEKCAEFLESENWQLIQTLLEEKKLGPTART
jgi:phage recombination protein Bet